MESNVVNRSKDKGTWWETRIVRYLVECGVPNAERRALRGQFDRGDIAGIVGVVIEAKNDKGMTLAKYLKEAHVERDNDNAAIGVAWIRRRGMPDPADAYVLMDGATFISLLRDADYIPRPAA
jgi:hypothetical protein